MPTTEVQRDATLHKPLPVTLLSGFLGSGKTTLLQHVLQSDHGLRIAVIVNDIGAINVDANLIKNTHRISKTEEKVIALQNGCICCTLRGDLLEELVRLSEVAEFDYIIVESSGISEPEQVAETFDSRLAEQFAQMGGGGDDANGMMLDESTMRVLQKLSEVGGLDKFAKLDTAVTVIDAFTMYHDFDTQELLSNRRDDVTPEDERTVSDLMVDQIEFADVIVLNKIDMVDESTKARIRDLIKSLNHQAKIVEASYGKIEVAEILNTGTFDLERAKTGAGWLQDLHEMTVRQVNGKNMVTPKPETEEYNVGNFVYVRHRPFHPQRLADLLHDKFILQHDVEEEVEEGEDDDEAGSDIDMEDAEPAHLVASSPSDRNGSSTEDQSTRRSSASTAPPSDGDNEDENEDDTMDEDDFEINIPDNDTILANKRAHPVFARLFRSKGEFWLATRPSRAGEWSQAGAMLTFKGGRPWFVTIDKSEYETGDAQIDALVQNDIQNGGEWGDRRQELVFIGERLDHGKVTELLDACLLTDPEWKRCQQIMRRRKTLSAEAVEERLANVFNDGFPDWPADDDHAGHDHPH